MHTDRYTKLMLTIIAACLVWISLGGPSLITPVQAANSGNFVRISGWVDSANTHHELPLPVVMR